ncbi:MAG: hypothetical protein MJ082_01840 [Clostridia bacterium]|nr:hypothetical protein [Clostridia bacterium]
MNSKFTKTLILAASLFFGACAAAFYTLAAIRTLMPSGFFYPKNYFHAALWNAVISVAIPVIFAVLSKDRASVAWDVSSPLSVLPLAAVGFCSVLVSYRLFGAIMANRGGDLMTFGVTLLTFLFGVCLAFSCAFSCIFPKSTRGGAAFLRLSAPMYFALYAGFLYLSKDFSLSSPIKILSEFAAGFCALFFLAELRLSLGKLQRRFYLAMCMITAAFSLFIGGGVICAYFCHGDLMAVSLEEAFLNLAVGIFAVCRFLSVLYASEIRTSPIVEALLAAEDNEEE